ncbi:MAG: tRNA (adenosine(37)-N6)-dimethylallyltransferase MiaA [Bacteroidia bacterium]|nr:tRNA (adenosine(37)-N6)-dimethylallyltransferase MiaA [Bacteroidia bacterium]
MKQLITLVGPTAVGKTRLSIKLAQHFGCPILSADSRQFYRGMDIGTAKATASEQAQAKHYFIDSLDIDEDFSAGKFETSAEALMKELFLEHDQLVMVGGSTLYMDAIWHGFDEMPKLPSEVRAKLKQELQLNGLPPLINELERVDPDTFEVIDRNNPARVIRALEVYRGTGIPISTWRKGRKTKTHAYQLIKIGLHDEREVLYDRINKRVLDMMEEGLLEEVKGILAKGHSPELNSLKSIGYQELISFLQNEITLEEAIRLIQRNSRRYAKRQLTYYRKFDDIKWFLPHEMDQVIKWIDPQ